MKPKRYLYKIFIPIFEFSIEYSNFQQAIRRVNSLLRAGYIVEMERVLK